MGRLTRFIVVASICFAVNISADGIADSSGYEILGLKLGMTAAEAETVIQQRLKLSPGLTPDAYKINTTPKHYQANGTFVDECVISNAKMELLLDFTEVYPGVGGGAEALYFISYTPKPVSPEDKDDFLGRIVAKFGQPTAGRDLPECAWVPSPYHSPAEANKADAPILLLDKSIPKLTLNNHGIRRRMENAARDAKKIPL